MQSFEGVCPSLFLLSACKSRLIPFVQEQEGQIFFVSGLEYKHGHFCGCHLCGKAYLHSFIGLIVYCFQ